MYSLHAVSEAGVSQAFVEVFLEIVISHWSKVLHVQYLHYYYISSSMAKTGMSLVWCDSGSHLTLTSASSSACQLVHSSHQYEAVRSIVNTRTDR